MAEKMKIIRGTLSGKEFMFNSADTANVIEVCFNPGEYGIDITNAYDEVDIPGLSSSIVKFKQGEPRLLSLDLMLDTYNNADEVKTDLRTEYIEPLEKLMDLDSDMHAPPPCQVLWGSLDFKGFVESMKKKYTLFASDGTPVRGKVTLKLKEYISLDEQINEASLASPDRRKLFKMRDGDNIWQMAYRAYGDSGQWRAIANANNIDDPLKLEAGRDLIIPVLERKDRR
jgi:Contractile injection system tube protein